MFTGAEIDDPTGLIRRTDIRGAWGDEFNALIADRDNVIVAYNGSGSILEIQNLKHLFIAVLQHSIHTPDGLRSVRFPHPCLGTRQPFLLKHMAESLVSLILLLRPAKEADLPVSQLE